MYKNIKIFSNDDEEKIHSLIDNLEFLISFNASDLIISISKINFNSRLKIFYKYEPPPFIKENIELLWMELNKPSVIHLTTIKEDMCKCCNSKPQQEEDQEIKDYLKYLNISNVN